ncbi:MAG TPA: hypothetical protein VG269_19220 [Tepidisphaeraceae bacterium]|jgi:hypothetical protein|nr:hypothetical protein [Tepidisphaeraceae bacterium]
MSQAAPSPAYLHLEDQIDLIGQKYRGQHILRGALLWLGGFVFASFAAILLAHFLGQGIGTRLVLAGWGTAAALTSWHWIVRPLLIRPDAVEVARFIESRVPGLHNGLTNGLLLARRADIAQSPWLPEIYEEIARTAQGKPLGGAVKIRDLGPLTLRLLILVTPLLLLAALLPKPFVHGFHQLFSPSAFVPKVGAAEIIEVQPGDATVVAGQPLEITLVARCPGNPKARLIFDKGPGADAGATSLAGAELSPSTLVDAGQRPDQRSDLQYNYRVDHVDQSARYRVEVAGTQSPWYTITAVRQVKLSELEIHIQPPPYTGQSAQTLTIKAADVAKSNVVVPQGSKVELSATVDVAVGGAMLQAGDAQPIAMDASGAGRRFTASFPVLDETPVAVLLTQGGKQIIARLPDDALVIHCIKDQPPVVEMKWPTQDVSVAPDAELKIRALLKDDYGVASSRITMAVEDASAPTAAGVASEEKGTPQLATVRDESYPPGTGVKEPRELTFILPVKPEQRKHGNTVRVQVEATDGRNLVSVMRSSADSKDAGGAQTTRSPIFTIKFEDPAVIAKAQQDRDEKLRARLTEMLKMQRALHEQTIAARPDDRDPFLKINTGQSDLRILMRTTAETFTFEGDERLAQKVLQKLSYEEAKDAVDQSAALQTEPAAAARKKLASQLQSSQRRIIDALETLLARLSLTGQPTTQPAARDGSDLLTKAEEYKKLDEALKAYMKEQQRILDQTTSLAKKPVDNWDDADKKKLDDLKMAQEKLDAFMQEKMHDFSKNAEQDMANSSLLKQLLEVYSETTMAKDALNQKAAEVAVAAEQNGIDNAKTLTSNLEKWLSNTPDRTKWTQEDLLSKTDVNMPELPKELEDIIGELMEQQEDLFDQMEDANANMAGSFDKGMGWDAADGPIASMNAQGVTGNQLPNNNEMSGRSGEGRSGKSQGEFVEDHATGKGGRNTPTRLDPTAFQKGQVKDDSKDPTGGATGGGKISGEGGAGLTGPVPPKQKQEMERLAQKQAELRNAAERISLQYKVGKYDNYKLDEAVSLMRRTESDLHANRYQNARRRRDVTLDALDTSRLLVGGEVHVQRDTTPAGSQKLNDQINDAMKGELPPAWSDALKEYYRKLGQQ